MQPETLLVPANAAQGSTYARFRLRTNGVAQSTGAAADGEVEDYQVVLTDAATPGLVTATANHHRSTDPASDGQLDTFRLTRSGET